MGVLPLVLPKSWQALGLTGEEIFDIPIDGSLQPRSMIDVTATKPDGIKITFPAKVRIDTPVELDYYRHGGILQTVLRKLLRSVSNCGAGVSPAVSFGSQSRRVGPAAIRSFIPCGFLRADPPPYTVLPLRRVAVFCNLAYREPHLRARISWRTSRLVDGKTRQP